MLWLRLIRNIAAAAGFLWLLVTCTPLDRWWVGQLAVPWGSGEGDVLVVLGGDATDGILGETSYWRSVYTVRALRNHTFRRVLITGNNGSAELMRDFVVAHGFSTDRIELDTQAGSTRENALKVRPMLANEKGKVVLLTSDYHVWRSVRVFRKLGIDVDPWPVPDVLKRVGCWMCRTEIFVELCREETKSAWYRWQGWI
jgi:uncharacterized SAM-binding protein YcdF (DUF218 family)